MSEQKGLIRLQHALSGTQTFVGLPELISARVPILTGAPWNDV